MTRSTPVIALALAFLLASIAPAAEKPNILFVFADDQCYETIGTLGWTDIDTPHLDRLVEGGMNFSRAYNMGSWSGAVCVASRHMLNTGTFLWHAEAISKQIGAADRKPGKKTDDNAAGWPDFQDQGLMWSQLMGEAGYDTYFTGKWHVRAKPERIFENVRNVRGGMPNQTPEGYNRPIDGQPDPWSPYDPKFEGFWKGGKHWSEVVGDDALAFLETAKDDADPFFMYIAFNAPHDPRQAPKEYVDRYPLDRIAMPENFLPEYPYNQQIDSGRGLRDEKLAPFPRTENAIKVNRQEYYAIITHMDHEIGRILDALEASGKADNTWIFFSADHGLAVGHHGLMGKQNLYEHSVRVPLLVKAPGVEAGSETDAPVYLQDIMTTSLELAGAEIPDHVQFQSLVPVIEGESEGYKAIYGAYLKGQRSVTVDGWKLILYPKVPKIRLFHIDSDPLEMNDLAEAPDQAERIQALAAALVKLQEETADTLDLSETFPDLF